MPWYFPWSDAIKLRACRYLLQRYLGQFLQHKIDLNQLSVDLYSGKGVVKDVLLDVELINDTFEAANLPFEIVDGFIGKVSVEIPWSALLSESTHVEIQGLEVTLKPKQVAEKSVMLSSMWGSMTKSSLQLAEECLKEEERTKRTQSSQFEGLEKFAQAIDIVLTRIKVDFTEIIIRLEQVRDDTKKQAVALEVRIQKLKYYDEAASNGGTGGGNTGTGNTGTGGTDEVTYHPLPISNKCFHVEGFTIFSDEYSLKPMNVSSVTTTLSPDTSLQNSELFYSTSDLGVSSHLAMGEENLLAVEGDVGGMNHPPPGGVGGMNYPPPGDVGGMNHPPPGDVGGMNHPRLSSSTNLVQMAVCHGVTEIRLKVKQSSEASGPKFELDGHVGILHAIVWPKQLEILRSLFGEVLNGKRPESKLKNEMQKPMTDSDYSKIEGELQRDFDVRHHQPRGGNNIQRSIWDNMNASREDEEFYSFTPRALTESSAPLGFNVDSNSKGFSVTTANSAKFRIKSCFITLLEENPKTTAHAPNFQYAELQRRSSAHFDSLAEVEAWDLQDTLALRDRFARSIPQSHIWFCASSVVAEGVERTSLSENTVTCRVSVNTLEMWEHLFDSAEPEKTAHVEGLHRLKTAPLCMELLTFPNRSSEDRFSFSPCVLVEYEAIESNNINLMQRHHQPHDRCTLKISLQNAKTDLDMTIIDRLQNLLHVWDSTAPPGGSTAHSGGGRDDHWSPTSPSPSTVPLTFSLLCTNLTALVRFPVLDLRPGSQGTPWWTRSLQKECLVADFSGFLFKTTFEHEKTSRRFDFECRNLTAALQKSPDEKPVVFLRAVRDVDTMLDEGRREEFAECPKMSIYTKKFSTNVVGANHSLYEPEEGSQNGSLEALVDSTEKDPSLFTTLRNMVEHEEINCVIPSSSAEAAMFKEDVVANSQLMIEISVPNITAFLPDKDLLEILYNRINTDLLLWEPASRRRGTDVIPLSAANLINNSGNFNKFEICSNSVLDDSASDVSDEEYENNQNDFQKRRQKLTASSGRSRLPSEACVVFNVTKASIGAKIENCGGKSLASHTAWMDLSKVSIFSVSAFRAQPEIKYSAIKIHQLSFYYGDWVESGGTSFDQAFRRPAHLLPLLAVLEEEMSVPSLDKPVEDQPMLNLAVAINVDTFRNVKDIKVALELAGIRLHHRVTKPENLWLTQMIEFVNLKDFPVLGYNSPSIITEFHLNIANSVLDYRPLYLPVCALVSVDSVNVSSNIVADSPQSLLRVITQDLRLHLSKRKSPTSLSKDYVCVVDVPFVEFQMKLTDGSNPKFPRFDFRASNNCCYVRTCADSCRELSDLIQYLADYGDLNSETRIVKSQVGNLSSAVPSAVGEEDVFEEMMDAMKESPPRRDSIPKSGFTSPVRPPPVAPPPNRTNMTGTLTKSLLPSFFNNNNNESDIDDDDFCIIEEDLGVGIPLKSGEPSIKFLTQEAIKIVENHFDQPLAVVDQLKSPDGFPLPLVRFTLREMSLIWCLYGGKDFDVSPESTARKLGPQNRLNSAPAKLGEARNASLKGEKIDQHTKSPSWLRQGGSGRDHSVLMELHLNKVRFQHEEYPFDGKNVQAARQVLFIQEFDIRDRLAASEINKFLYQYVSNSLPRQSHASMLSIKALHERPDPAQPMQECSLKISLQPLRLNVDQESLFFLNDFFADVSASGRPDNKDAVGGGNGSANGPSDSVPVPASRPRRLESLCEEEPLVHSSALIHFDDAPKGKEEEERLESLSDPDPFLGSDPSLVPGPSLVSDPSLVFDPADTPVFFKSVTFSPEVPIRLDYHGKYVDMQRVGAFGGLLVGLAQLKCSMLRLKRVHSRQGLRGFDKLILHLLNEWLDDIRKTQLANLLGGVGPMHCLVQLVQGVRDLFWLPVEQYRKDGRIVRGVQRGATAFTTSTLIATIELTNRIVQTVQVAAESAYDVISPGPSFRRKKRLASAVAPRFSQPGDIREGVVTAYHGLVEGFSDTYREIVDAVSEEREQKGVTGAVGGALRQIPPAIVKPLILASQATSNVLGGLRNQLQPENKQDEMEKWRTENDVRNVNTQLGHR